MQVIKTSPLDSARIMARVIFALMIRESQSRYGHLKIGYLWVFLEPLLFTVVFIFLFTFRVDYTPPGMSLVLFFTTGLIPFSLFRDVLSRTMLAVKSNKQLLTYPQVQLFDLCTARALFETFSHITVFIIFVGVIYLGNIEPVHIDDLGRMLSATTLLALLGYGAGLIAASLIPLFPSIEFLVRTVVIQPMFFLSGVFFTADMMPLEFKSFILLNPVMQLLEMFRSAFFLGYESPYVNYEYVTSVVLLYVFFGLLLQRALRRYAYQA